jgi:hypothetical protein
MGPAICRMPTAGLAEEQKIRSGDASLYACTWLDTPFAQRASSMNGAFGSPSGQ